MDINAWLLGPCVAQGTRRCIMQVLDSLHYAVQTMQELDSMHCDRARGQRR